ncbi:MAG: hypothetical protein P8Y63_11280 [Deltaproteobacteria bacterium]
MHMIGHQTKGMNTVPVFTHAFLEEEIKARPVGPGEKDVLPAVATQDDVVHCARVMDARFSSHAFSYQPKINMSSLTPFM